MDGLYDGEFFGFRVATSTELNTALHEAVVAVDANMLLDLYRFRPQTSQDLIDTLRHFGDRLVVPNQAMREFWRRRQRIRDSPRFATEAATKALDRPKGSIYAALQTWSKAVGAEDSELSDLTGQIDDFFETLSQALHQAVQEADEGDGEDSVLDQLETILAGRVTPPLEKDEHEACLVEATRRTEAEEPPGYKDAEKQDSNLPDGGAGDYLVWYQVTRYAKDQNRDLLIITRDQKEDWWWRQQAKFIGPRPELALEYHRLTGRRLYMMLPSELLERASVLGVKVHRDSSADAGRELATNPLGVFSGSRHGLTLDEEESELSRELDAIEKAAKAQGWRVKTRSDTAFRLIDRNGESYSFPLGSAAETRDLLRPFAQRLADIGLRISQPVLMPVNDESAWRP